VSAARPERFELSRSGGALTGERALRPDRAAWQTLIGGFLCYSFDAVDFAVLALALPLIIAEWNLTLGEAGLIGTAGMLGVGVSGVLMGWLADNQGRRRVLLLSVVLFALFTAAGALTHRRWELMALRGVAGLGLGGVWGVVTALVNETWPRPWRGRAISVLLSAWPVGLIGAALLAGWVVPTYGWRALFLCGALALLAALYVLCFVPESAVWKAQHTRSLATDSEQTERQPVAVAEIFAPRLRRNTLLATAAAAFYLTAYWGANTWWPTYLIRERGLSTQSMTHYLIVLNAGLFCGYPLLGWIADRTSKRTALLLSWGAAAMLLPVYAMIRDLNVLLWMGPVVACCFAATGPLGAYFTELFPTRVRCLGAGFCFNVGRGLAAFAPFAFGALATRFGLAVSLALCGVGFLMAALMLLLLPHDEKLQSFH
jgi:MFS family permease